VRLDRVANGSIWDDPTRSFIRSQSNHTGWDALVFRAKDPRSQDGSELEEIVLFVLFLDKLLPFLVLFSRCDDGPQDALQNTTIGVNELLSWSKLREKTRIAAREEKERLEDRNASLSELHRIFGIPKPCFRWGTSSGSCPSRGMRGRDLLSALDRRGVNNYDWR
jgi:hypothetical protein